MKIKKTIQVYCYTEDGFIATSAKGMARYLMEKDAIGYGLREYLRDAYDDDVGTLYDAFEEAIGEGVDLIEKINEDWLEACANRVEDGAEYPAEAQWGTPEIAISDVEVEIEVNV